MTQFLNIEIQLKDNPYTIHIEPGIVNRLGAVVSELGLSGAATIITDEQVGALHAERVAASLENPKTDILRMPAGEEHKTLDTVRTMYDELLSLNRGRDSYIVALGGGVVGDLAGFVAATYLRGIPFIQIPTSLLAQVDSSIGGKVGVDLPQGKNLVGAFYQPRVVCIDPEVLKTLERRHLINGLVEVIKHGVIWHDRFFTYLEDKVDSLLNLDSGTLVETIGRSCRIKADVVEQDEKESGIRVILNFGHTIAHAVETCAEYKGWLHGEAVAVGMLAETRIAQKLGLTTDDTFRRQERLLQRVGLPTRLPVLDLERFQKAVLHDKKNLQMKIRMVLPVGIGRVQVVDDVPWQLIADTAGELTDKQ